MPGLTPQEANESEGRRGLSQSVRDCGEENWAMDLGFDGEVIIGVFRKRRGFCGKDKDEIFENRVWGFGEEGMRKRRDRAVKKRSGSDVGLCRFLQRLLEQLLIGACCCGGGFWGGGGGGCADISQGVCMRRRRRRRWRRLLAIEDGLGDVG